MQSRPFFVEPYSYAKWTRTQGIYLEALDEEKYDWSDEPHFQAMRRTFWRNEGDK